MTGSGKGNMSQSLGAIWERVNPFPVQTELGKKIMPDDTQRQELIGNLGLATGAAVAPGVVSGSMPATGGGATANPFTGEMTGGATTAGATGDGQMFNMFKNMASGYGNQQKQEPYKSKYRMPTNY